MRSNNHRISSVVPGRASATAVPAKAIRSIGGRYDNNRGATSACSKARNTRTSRSAWSRSKQVFKTTGGRIRTTLLEPRNTHDRNISIFRPSTEKHHHDQKLNSKPTWDAVIPIHRWTFPLNRTICRTKRFIHYPNDLEVQVVPSVETYIANNSFNRGTHGISVVVTYNGTIHHRHQRYRH